MIKRKAYEQLVVWKSSSNGSTALLIEGARRVGKSYLASEFGRAEYKTCLIVDFTFAPDEVLGYFRDMRSDLDSFSSTFPPTTA